MKRYQTERRRSRVGCLAVFVALIWLVVIVVAVYRYWLAPQLSAAIGTQIGGQVVSQPTSVVGQIEDGAAGALPGAVAALPNGEVRVSEAQINQYLADNAEALKPVEAATVRLVPGELQADITLFGLTSTARTGLAVQQGRVIAVNPEINGALGELISAKDLAAALERQLNAQLSAQGRRISDVRIEQGELVVVVG